MKNQWCRTKGTETEIAAKKKRLDEIAAVFILFTNICMTGFTGAILVLPASLAVKLTYIFGTSFFWILLIHHIDKKIVNRPESK